MSNLGLGAGVSCLLVALMAGGCQDKPGPKAQTAAQDTAPRPPIPPPVTSTTGTVVVLPPAHDTTLPWPDFAAAIRANPDSVRAVLQAGRRVTATLRSGIRLHAVQPGPGQLLGLLREVDPAGHIILATQ
jgi:hypothetical protein